MLTSRIIVYSDLNCPFCFILNEWLEANGQADRVRWRGVEHMPELAPALSESDEVQAELSREIASVRDRAPEIEISRPPNRPNSRLAIATLLSVEEAFPDRAAELRTLVFRALWQRGQDISSPAVLANVLKEAGIEAAFVPAPNVSLAQECFEEWDQAKYCRIPALRAPTGATYLGLGDAKALHLFMGSALFDMARPGSCTVG
tara:strand:+ start:40230 stop:40838 length:609 start_codon:yes stop_codon:yes gene_type:complete